MHHIEQRPSPISIGTWDQQSLEITQSHPLSLSGLLEECPVHVLPFPNSLMVAIAAEYESGELTIDHEEIAHADFFPCHCLPPVPPKLSSARDLIDDFVIRCGGGPADQQEWGPMG